MRRKYGDCQRQDGNCALCALVNYGRDCHNRPISNMEFARRGAELTQQQLADAAGVNLSLIQKVERGDVDAGNITAKNLLAIASALDVDPMELI